MPTSAPNAELIPGHADVVIVGGGVMGTSIAFHLAEAGVSDVVVLERDELGSGSSGKPIGGVRAQFSDPLNIELGARSLRAYQDFARRPGQDIKLDNVGYLFLLTTSEQVAAFRDSVAVQNELGVPSRLISADEARQLCPYVTTDGLLAAAFSPDDGHARPALVIEGYAQAAAKAGVRIMTHSTVTAMDTRHDRITAVHTSRGTITCSAVVCAAGAWSARIGEMAGVDLPVLPFRRQIALTVPLRPSPPRVPFTIDFDSSGYFHNSDDGLLFGLADPRETAGFDTEWTADWLEPFRAAMLRRAPDLADMAVATGWAGLYEVTPDHNALIGRASSPENFVYATGFSGHGFLQAPAVGEIVRDLYLGRTPPVDVTPLSCERFSAGNTIRPEGHVV
ncbi:NAD(P)/FAD-dependent oxidoreductase [Phytoactinopolyspora endophytica]|uniref:NAD(P)/FAD-dependent oxidoreductase n=1 Tax=Phytoactinopolyspora endophytica TaxID=1642495 RepID=UPI00101D4CCB|nr:FAD-binding oxidoreductase [Phytoactinopolyspora endophytica]